MKNKQVIKVSALSVLTVALLTACGGGSGGSSHDFFKGRDTTTTTSTTGTTTGGTTTGGTTTGGTTTGGTTTGGTTGTSTTTPVDENGSLSPIGNSQPMDTRTFMTSLEGPGSSLNTKGQQNFAIVASVDNDSSKSVTTNDEVRWNQSGVISAICSGESCSSKDGHNANIDSFYRPLLEAAGDDKALKAELEREQALLSLADGIVYMLDTNGVYHTVTDASSIDFASNNATLLKNDVGAVKLTGEIKNGQTIQKSGEFDRAYSGITVFKTYSNSRYYTNNATSSELAATTLNGYLRDASSLGMSYNTFGVFGGSDENLSTTRGINYAYQSIGVMTQNVPTTGKAEYNGKSHAYLNDKQVTMDVKIEADFANRSLVLSSSNAAIHDIATNKHTVEYNDNYGISGTGSWDNPSSTYSGDVKTVGGLTGKVEGRFYGPNADETGGVFGLQNADGSTEMVGGYAARRK